MNKHEIQQHLRDNHYRFIELVNHLSDADFLYSNNGKWTAGQQLDHILKSIRPVYLALLLPSFLLQLFFGKAKRPSKTYEGLVEKYELKLSAGGKATAPFIPKSIAFENRSSLSKRLYSLLFKLANHVEGFSEKELDTLILPHPLLGKLTLREMLYFTIHHVEHHEKQTLQNLINSKVEL